MENTHSGTDILWMESDVIRHKLRVIGAEAFMVYATCCHFQGEPGGFSLEKMSGLIGLSMARCKAAMQRLELARLVRVLDCGDDDYEFYLMPYRHGYETYWPTDEELLENKRTNGQAYIGRASA